MGRAGDVDLSLRRDPLWQPPTACGSGAGVGQGGIGDGVQHRSGPVIGRGGRDLSDDALQLCGGVRRGPRSAFPISDPAVPPSVDAQDVPAAESFRVYAGIQGLRSSEDPPVQ